MMKALFVLISVSLLVTTVRAQTGFTPPQVGLIQDDRGLTHPVNGLAGNFVLGPIASSGVVSAAFSGSFGILKLSSALRVTDAQGQAIASAEAPAGSALFAFSENGSPALAYFERTRTFRIWNGHSFEVAGPAMASIENETVLSIAALDSTQAILVVERENGLWELGVEVATGAVVSQLSLPGIQAPVLLVAGGAMVYRDAQGVVVRRADGAEKRIAAQLPAKIAFGQMGRDWVCVTDLSTSRLFAVSIQPGRERYYVLPEVRP